MPTDSPRRRGLELTASPSTGEARVGPALIRSARHGTLVLFGWAGWVTGFVFWGAGIVLSASSNRQNPPGAFAAYFVELIGFWLCLAIAYFGVYSRIPRERRKSLLHPAWWTAVPWIETVRESYRSCGRTRSTCAVLAGAALAAAGGIAALAAL